MTTDNTEQRSVSELLHVLETDGTYQGMTDDEIKSIIEYEKARARIAGINEELTSSHAQHRAAMESMTASSLQAQETMLQSIIDRATSPQLQVVQYG